MRREGWHRALDIQMETHKWCLQDTPALYNVGFMSSVIGHVAEDELSSPLVTGTSIVLSKLFTETMWQADTLYVTSDMMHILMQAAHDLPADASFDDHVLITPTGFCMFEEPIVGTDRRDKRILIHAIAWQKQLLQTTDSGEKKMGLVIFFLVDPLDPLDDYNHMFRETGVAMGMPCLLYTSDAADE